MGWRIQSLTRIPPGPPRGPTIEAWGRRVGRGGATLFYFLHCLFPFSDLFWYLFMVSYYFGVICLVTFWWHFGGILEPFWSYWGHGTSLGDLEAQGSSRGPAGSPVAHLVSTFGPLLGSVWASFWCPFRCIFRSKLRCVFGPLLGTFLGSTWAPF